MKMKTILLFLSRGYLLELIVMLIQCWKWLVTTIQSNLRCYSNESFNIAFDCNLNASEYRHCIVIRIHVFNITQMTFYYTIQKSFNTTTKSDRFLEFTCESGIYLHMSSEYVSRNIPQLLLPFSMDPNNNQNRLYFYLRIFNSLNGLINAR